MHTQINKLVERNNEAVKKALHNSPEVLKIKESFKKTFGYEMNDTEKFPIHSSNFNFTEARKMIEANMKEADSTSGFVQLLRAGVQNFMMTAYESVTTTFEKWTTVFNSKKDTEIFAPIQGIGFPSEVPQNGLYSEVGMAGLDLKLQNRKFGSIFGVTYELDSDDQTSQVRNQAAAMGEYAKLLVEVYVYGKLASPAGGCEYSGLKVPVSETQPSDESAYPFSVALKGGGRNRPDAFGALTQANIQAGFIGMMNQKNLLGLKMSVNPNTLLVGPHYSFDTAVLANSSFYPSVPSATPGATGTSFAINPLVGKFNPIVSRYMFDNNGSADADSKAWYLLDSTKPFFVVSMREGATLTNEAPNAGESFNRDLIRFKMRTRFNADFIDPRFIWKGSDGSI